jgi:hypothetical protein
VKKTVAGIFILLLCVTEGNASDTSSMKFDGNEWIKLDKTVKIFLLAGFITGNEYVALHHKTPLDKFDDPEDSRLGVEIEKMKESEKMPLSKEQISTLRQEGYFTINRSLEAYDLSGIVVNQILDGLDELYKDVPNRKIKLEDAVYIVKKEIKGISKDDLEQILLFFRTGREVGKLDQTDIEVITNALIEGKMAPSQIPRVGGIVAKDKHGKFIKFIPFP